MHDHSLAAFVSEAMWEAGEFKTKEEFETHFENTIFKKLLADSFSNGIVVLCSAGNEGKVGTDVSTRVPAGLSQVQGSEDLIVVGSVGPTGQVSDFTNKDKDGRITVYANGEDVIAASNENNDGWTIGQGTSEATAMTSGLVAYFLGRPGVGDELRANGNANVARNVKRRLLKEAYAYSTGGKLILNNGELDIGKNGACSLPGSPRSNSPVRVRRGAGLVKRAGDGFDLTTTALEGLQVSFSEVRILGEC